MRILSDCWLSCSCLVRFNSPESSATLASSCRPVSEALLQRGHKHLPRTSSACGYDRLRPACYVSVSTARLYPPIETVLSSPTSGLVTVSRMTAARPRRGHSQTLFWKSKVTSRLPKMTTNTHSRRYSSRDSSLRDKLFCAAFRWASTEGVSGRYAYKTALPTLRLVRGPLRRPQVLLQ